MKELSEVVPMIILFDSAVIVDELLVEIVSCSCSVNSLKCINALFKNKLINFTYFYYFGAAVDKISFVETSIVEEDVEAMFSSKFNFFLKNI